MAGRGELRHVPRGVYMATFGGSWRVFSPVAAKKRVVRTMLAHGARFSVYQIMLGHKM
jgi:hypothetical protein